ncbi:MAG: preprotein translocase subunit SecD, partial [Pirellulaceae bacterium]
QEEVKYLVNILESGALPATLNKVPIAENQVGAAMGQDAIGRAYFASLLALIATFIFVLLYYRFSGLVASIALIINLLLIMAGMLIIQQPITLAGLAGIVLSVGMSFDANVLVFERIREEIAKKATGRMVIRNGFDRAWTTIFDSNFTTLITAVVLYWLGTDQVRGFAVSLIIGLVVSMFTAVFCSHVLFDVAERLRIVNFSMADAIA